MAPTCEHGARFVTRCVDSQRSTAQRFAKGGIVPSVARIESVYVQLVHDDDPDASWLEQSPRELGSITAAVENRRRLLALQRGDWYFVGARLAADVLIHHDGRTPERLTLTTPGVWGIESDSDVDYFREVALDDWDYLAADLAALGLDIGSVMPPQDYNIQEV